MQRISAWFKVLADSTEGCFGRSSIALQGRLLRL